MAVAVDIQLHTAHFPADSGKHGSQPFHVRLMHLNCGGNIRVCLGMALGYDACWFGGVVYGFRRYHGGFLRR